MQAIFASPLTFNADLQATYSNYKNTLQSLAQKVGEIEQEVEEHKYGYCRRNTQSVSTDRE